MKLALKLLGAAVVIILLIGAIAPFFTLETYAARLQNSLSRSLGRKVELGPVHFSLFKGPGFSVDWVRIHEDPAIGLEPLAYIEEPGAMEVVPSLWSLLGGKFVISSIRLDEASINLTKSGPAEEWGRWNFASFVNPGVIHTAPEIHVRNSRIHFKFGDTKNVFYLTETDLDVSPTVTGDLRITCSGRPARSDRPARGFGSFTARGRWYNDVGRIELDVRIDHTNLGEVTALIGGEDAGVHGDFSSRLHIAGPLQNLGITGRLDIADVHRWDMLPTNSQGWTLWIGGKLNLTGQQIELHSSTPGNAPLPLAVHFRATDYLAQPHWAVSLNWNHFPVGPILELARHMGAQLPPRLQFAGTMDGAVGYSGHGSLQGAIAFQDAALTIPDSPALRFEHANLTFYGGHAHLSPALARSGDTDQARLEADYAFDPRTLDLTISTDAMDVHSLRAQVSLASVPCLEQFTAGTWRGDLRYHRDPDSAGWSGEIKLADATIGVPGLASPVLIASANAQIDGARLVIDHIAAQAGKLAFAGEYRYEPALPRPHRLRLRADTWDAADLEAEVMPTLRRSGNLFERTLGRPMVTDWLRERSLEGTVQIEDLAVAGAHLENFRGHVLWDVARVQIDGIQANLEDAAVTGKLDVNLRGTRPNYKLAAKVKGMAWQSGKVDLDAAADTFGTGVQLLTNLNVDGTLNGANLDFTGLAPLRTAAGAYNLSWWQSGPRLRLSALNLRTDEDTYIGRGATQEDGRLLVVLSSGAKEMRMTGTLAKLKIE